MLELVISVVLLGIIGSLGLFVIQNQLHGNLDSNAEVIVSRLVEAQFRSIAGASNTAWGIRFINGTSTSDRYELFEGDAYTASTITYFLSGLIEFEDPTPGSSTDITFTKLRGTTPVSSTIKIRLKSNPSSSKSISISDKGKLSIE